MSGPTRRSKRNTPIKRSNSSSSLFEEEQGFEVNRQTNNKDKSSEIIVLSSSSESSEEDHVNQSSNRSSSSDCSSVSHCDSSISSSCNHHRVYTQDQEEGGMLSTLLRRKESDMNNDSSPALETQPPPSLPSISSMIKSSSSANNHDTMKSASFANNDYKIPRKENNNRRNRDLPNQAENKIYGSYKKRNINYKDDMILFDRSQIDYAEHGIEKKPKTTKSTSLDDKVVNLPSKKEKRSNKGIHNDKEKIADGSVVIDTSLNSEMDERDKISYVEKVDLPQSVSNKVIERKNNHDSFDKNLADTVTKNNSRKKSSTKETKSILTNIEEINKNDANNNTISSNKSCSSSSSSSSKSMTVSVKVGNKRSVLEAIVLLPNNTIKSKKKKKDPIATKSAVKVFDASLHEKKSYLELDTQPVEKSDKLISTPEEPTQCSSKSTMSSKLISSPEESAQVSTANSKCTLQHSTFTTTSNKKDDKNQSVTSKKIAAPAKKTKSPPTKKLAITPRKKKKTLQDQTFHTMFISCKPYTMKTLAQATKSTQEVLNSMMLSLVDKDLVKKREFGKFNKTLYWANQDTENFKEVKIDIASPEERKKSWDECNTLMQQERNIRQQLVTIEKEPSNEDLDQMIQKMEDEMNVLNNTIQETNGRIEKGFQPSLINRGNNTNKFNKNAAQKQQQNYETNPNKIKKTINCYRNEWKQRKEKCMDFLDNLSDAMEKKLKDIFKMLDVERDEDLNVKIPPKYVIES